MTAGDLGNDVGQVALWIDGVQLTSLDQRGDDCPMFAAVVRTSEERILAVQRNRPDRAFGDVRVDLDATVVDEAHQAFPVRQGIADLWIRGRTLREPPLARHFACQLWRLTLDNNPGTGHPYKLQYFAMPRDLPC